MAASQACFTYESLSRLNLSAVNPRGDNISESLGRIETSLLNFSVQFRDRLIGRTSAFEAEYPGSSPGPGTILSATANSTVSLFRSIRHPRKLQIEIGLCHASVLAGLAAMARPTPVLRPSHSFLCLWDANISRRERRTRRQSRPRRSQ
jgi:hypothetical protein